MTILYQLQGEVIKGKQVGQTLGFPTANITYPVTDVKRPKDGVYIAITHIISLNKSFLSLLNQGSHPTLPEGKNTIEVHLLDYSGEPLYGELLKVKYISYIRSEIKFNSKDELREQLKKDLNSIKIWEKENNFELNNNLFYTNTLDNNINACVNDLYFRYEDEANYAVDDVNIQFTKGSFTAILGHNGCGKSTLAKLLNALFLPDKGTVIICGMDTQKEQPVWNIRKHAGMVFQNPDNQIVANVVREDVAFGLENLGVPVDEMIPRIKDALESVRMSKRADSAPHMLSGGQKQRVAIAGVLAMQPDIMIFDESTAMLDPSGRKEVMQTVQKLNKEKGITVIWITHFMEEAALCDSVIVMDKGKIALQGKPTEVFSQVEKIKNLGLDVPPMTELANALRAEGIPLSKKILTVEDMLKELSEILCPLS